MRVVIQIKSRLTEAVLHAHENMEQYNILGRTGEGAHGIVFKAKHIEVTDWCFYVCILPHFFFSFLFVIRSALNLESNLSGLEM